MNDAGRSCFHVGVDASTIAAVLGHEDAGFSHSRRVSSFTDQQQDAARRLAARYSAGTTAGRGGDGTSADK